MKWGNDMLINKEIIEETIWSNFIDDVDTECVDIVSDLTQSDIEEADCFDDIVEFVEFNSVDNINVIKYNYDEDESCVDGKMEITMNIDGSVYWDGEYVEVGQSTFRVTMDFMYQIENEVCSRFQIYEVYF